MRTDCTAGRVLARWGGPWRQIDIMSIIGVPLTWGPALRDALAGSRTE